MRRFKKILKWTAIVLVMLILILTFTIFSRQNLTYSAPYPNIKASADSAIIARGKHLVISSAHCINCHSNHNPDSLLNLGQEVALTGGVLFDLDLGKVYSKNITPDKETGIGKYSDAEIARALRHGVHPNGTAVFDFMPFHNTSDEDLTAIISYLRSQKPVRNEVPTNQLNFLGKAVKAFMVVPVGPDGEVPKSVIPDTTATYGKYLALCLAECNGCHTQRDLAGAYIGEPFAGGNNIDGVISANITPDSTSKIFGWPKETFITRFRAGKLVKNSPMPWNSFKRMTDDELTAIYHYLQTIKPAKMPTPK